MFDFHLHSGVSFDSKGNPGEMVKTAEKLGLKEMCFTDHYDFNTDKDKAPDLFTMEEYGRAYDNLSSESVLIRRGVEFGLTHWNTRELEKLLRKRSFDFVIGSVHYVDGYDPYYKEFWEGLDNIHKGFEKYLLQTLECVKVHNNYDVLGHLTYVCKSEHNPTHEPVLFKDFKDITDEIMKILVEKGKGMEINTSGVDRVGDFLPSKEFLKRFKELGGEIITVGSDSHDETRVGQYANEALEIVKDIFGYVCTFENRKPIFHKLR